MYLLYGRLNRVTHCERSLENVMTIRQKAFWELEVGIRTYNPMRNRYDVTLSMGQHELTVDIATFSLLDESVHRVICNVGRDSYIVFRILRCIYIYILYGVQYSMNRT